MKYLAKSFSSRPSTKAYRDNFDETFRSNPEPHHMFVSPAVYEALKADARKKSKKNPSKGTK